MTIPAGGTDALRGDLEGPLLLPGEDGYEERLGFNRVLDPNPLLVVGAAGPKDVAVAVRSATANGLPVGGKGNFGVVTELEIELVPVSRLFGGALVFPGASSPEVLRAYARWVGEVPDEMTSSFAFMRLPDLPLVPEPLRGQFVAAVRVCFVGEADQGAALLEPLRAAGDRVVEQVGSMPYTDAWTIYMDPTEPMPSLDATAVLDELGDGAVDTLLQAAGPDSGTALLVVEVRHLGGALARPPQVPGAVGHRDAPFNLYAVAPVFPGMAATVDAGFQSLQRAIAPIDTGKVLLNFLGPRTAGPEWVRRAFEPETYQRLVTLKAAYDPDNLFRLNHNIPPAGTPGDGDGS